MNTTLKTLLVFAALVVAIVVASLVYRQTALPATPAPTEPGAAAEPIDPATLHPELRLALEALEQDREDDAIQHLQAVPSDSEFFPVALQRLAVVLARRGDYSESISALVRLTTVRPDDAEVHATLAWVFYLAERYPEAELAALRVFELDPDHLGTRYNIGLYRVAQSRTQLAIQSYVRAMRADPNGEVILEHRDRLQAYHDAHPDESAPHYALAFFANSMQDHALEGQELDHFLAVQPAGIEADAAREKLDDVRAALAGD